MGISGSDKSLLYALAGVERAGASRADDTLPQAFVSIGGVALAQGSESSLIVVEELNEASNTARVMSYRGATEPVEGQNVVVTLGSINNRKRTFAGSVINRTHAYVDTPANWNAQPNFIDYTWQLTRRRFSGSFTNTAPSAIAAAIVAVVPGFALWVEPGLPALDAFSQTDVTALQALTALAKAVGGYCDVDYDRVVKLFVTGDALTAPTDLTSTHASLEEFSFYKDFSRTRTRMFVEGGGGKAKYDVAAGATMLQVDAIPWYNAGGGTVKVNQQHVTYTGLGLGDPLVEAWTARTPATFGVSWIGVTWAPALGLFVALATSGSAVMTSPDGINWTARTAAEASSWAAVVWAPSLSLFVAVATSGTHQVMTSPDGITWTARTAAAVKTWSAVEWAPSLSLFVAVAINSADTSSVMTSPDGITWTLRTAASINSWRGVAWAPSLSLFVAVSLQSAVMTSPDGITWTARTAAIAQCRDVAWSPALSLFAAVSDAVTTSSVMTSPDGTTWTARATPTSGPWSRIVWAAGYALFVMVSSSATGGVATSPDGINWTVGLTPTSVPSAPAIGRWQALAWAQDIGRIVALGNSSGDIFVMTNGYNALTGIPASGAGSILYNIKQSDPVNLLVQVDDLAAQAALATIMSNDGIVDDGIIEDYVIDGTIGETEARARGEALLALKSTAQLTIRYKCRDKNSHAGGLVTVNFGPPTNLVGQFRIQHVTISRFTPGMFPLREVEASNDRFSLEDLLRVTRQRAA